MISYYIYRFDKHLKNYIKKQINSNFFNENIPITTFKTDSKIKEYKFENQDVISGDISIEDISHIIPIKIRLDSQFLLIETDIQSQKMEVIKVLLNIFRGKGKLKNFTPFPSKERELICESSDESEIKFLHNNKIVYSKELKEKYCKKMLKEDYKFFEADLIFKSEVDDNEDSTLLYYKNMIKFSEKDDVEFIMQKFENIMSN